MSSVAKDYAYRVIINKNNRKPEPTIDIKTLLEYKADIKKYIKSKV